MRYGSDCGVDTHALGPQMVRQNLRDVKVGQDCEADVVKAVVDEQLLIRYSDRHEVNRPLTKGMTAVPVAGLPLFAKAPF